MLITFRCNASADITMFGSIGLQMLQMMGYGDRVPGAIKAENAPLALERLTSALSIEKEKPDPPEQPESEDDEENDPPVSLANRALPLITMLNAAINEECDIIWESE